MKIFHCASLALVGIVCFACSRPEEVSATPTKPKPGGFLRVANLTPATLTAATLDGSMLGTGLQPGQASPFYKKGKGSHTIEWADDEGKTSKLTVDLANDQVATAYLIQSNGGITVKLIGGEQRGATAESSGLLVTNLGSSSLNAKVESILETSVGAGNASEAITTQEKDARLEVKIGPKTIVTETFPLAKGTFNVLALYQEAGEKWKVVRLESSTSMGAEAQKAAAAG